MGGKLPRNSPQTSGRPPTVPHDDIDTIALFKGQIAQPKSDFSEPGLFGTTLGMHGIAKVHWYSNCYYDGEYGSE